MLALWRLWAIVIILAFGWSAISYALTRNPRYLHISLRLCKWTGGLGLLLTLFWLIGKLLR
ncbi:MULTISPECIES: hypothetical protein [Aquitalea]|uniref:Transmembrane protein n=1 Tax=Aquitalea magnusonii TaxID=332411 RepID=A0A318JKF5_9NEIS|nr:MULTISPECIES: hypothetical protein [Aquitalea]PXX49977.1 hypothetical protein DFR38_103157 [Aquitalea magnusonii]